jgi:hypothetical protein
MAAILLEVGLAEDAGGERHDGGRARAVAERFVALVTAGSPPDGDGLADLNAVVKEKTLAAVAEWRGVLSRALENAQADARRRQADLLGRLALQIAEAIPEAEPLRALLMRAGVADSGQQEGCGRGALGQLDRPCFHRAAAGRGGEVPSAGACRWQGMG